MDCSTVNYGCDGGFINKSFYYAMYNGLVSRALYPYTAKVGTCKLSSITSTSPPMLIKSYNQIAAGDV